MPNQDPDPATATIPQPLLHRLLQQFFENGTKTRVSQPALDAVGEYTKTFIREAIWRAAAVRRDGEGGYGEGGDGGGGGVEGMSVFLEVEDLEKLAPQLLLDF